MQTAAVPVPAQKRNGGGFGFIAYANSRVEKLRDEGRYDAAYKLKMYLRRFIAYLGKNEVPHMAEKSGIGTQHYFPLYPEFEACL